MTEKFPWQEVVQQEINLLGPEDYIEPDTELDPNTENLLGICPLPVQKLYILAKLYERRSLETGIRAKFEPNSKKKTNLIELAQEYYEKYQSILDQFWSEIREEFNLWNKGTGIRKGWKVVYHNKKEDAINQFLKLFLGEK